MHRIITALAVSFLVALSAAMLYSFSAPVPSLTRAQVWHVGLAIGFVALVLGSVLALLRAVRKSPKGYQDHNGFHTVLALALIGLVASSGGHHGGHGHRHSQTIPTSNLAWLTVGMVGFGLLGMDRFSESAIRARCRFFNQQYTDTFRPDLLRDLPPAALDAIADAVLALGPTAHKSPNHYYTPTHPCDVIGCYSHSLYRGTLSHIVDITNGSAIAAKELEDYYSRRGPHYCGD